jgi:hypothetical protein
MEMFNASGLVPLRNYNAPKFPTLQSARDNPELLKKLPKRWQKKAAVVACVGVVGFSAFSAGAVYAHEGFGETGFAVSAENPPSQTEITVTLDGVPIEFDVAPAIINGRTLVPARAVFEAMGFEVEWNERSQRVRISNTGQTLTIILPVGIAEMFVSNMEGITERILLDVPAQIVNGRTLVPLRAIAEATGAHVEWNASTRTVQISTPEPPPPIIEELPRPPQEEIHLPLAEFRARLETAELELRTHYGGANSGPFYTVYFTEQEAFGFFRAVLEDAGLNFGDEPPAYTYHGMFDSEYGLDLFDAQRNVAITRVFDFYGYEIDVAEALSQIANDITVGVFTNQGEMILGRHEIYDIYGALWAELSAESGGTITLSEFDSIFEEIILQTLDERKIESREILIERLTAQAQELLAVLHAEENPIAIRLNRTPLELNTPPILLDGMVFVSMHEMLEVFGMQASRWFYDSRISFRNEDASYDVEIGSTEMRIVSWDDDVRHIRIIELPAPPRLINNRIYIPLCIISEANIATVEWNERTRTIRITTN